MQVNKKEVEQIKEVDLVLGLNEKNDIVHYIEEFLSNKNSDIDITDVMHQKEFLEFGDGKRDGV